MKCSIRRGGENISASEIEQVFLEHPDVVACAAVGIPDVVMGEEVKLVVVRRAEATSDEAALHAYAGSRMASFMVPRYIEIVPSLPYTDVGKLKREESSLPGRCAWDARTASQKSFAGVP